ncbi:MAG: hypothetical protein LBM09_02970 [Candidatus Nomurabacteria bacterium]|jgi:hypothetical protein|nr:hypothetical protein [Candidatus Nomurabacteria bacterium]
MKGWKQAFKNEPWRTDDLKRDRRILKWLRNIRVWQLAVILLILAMLAAIFLRLNNIGMMELRAALIKADTTGDAKAVQNAAVKLQNYTAHHMNTYTGRVALQTLYDDAVQKAIDKAKPVEIDASLYKRISEECYPARLNGGGSRAQAQCISEKIGVSLVNVENVEVISPDAFYVEFAPTRISFDAAGITVMLCYFVIFIIIVRIISTIILRIILKIKYRAA